MLAVLGDLAVGRSVERTRGRGDPRKYGVEVETSNVPRMSQSFRKLGMSLEAGAYDSPLVSPTAARHHLLRLGRVARVRSEDKYTEAATSHQL